jgi:hypothetical protein
MVIGALALSAATWRSAVAYGICLILVSGGLLYEAGNPRPVWTVIQPIQKATLVGVVLDEPNAIYIWILQQGGATPVAYQLPWSEKTAVQLDKAQKKAAKDHTHVGVQLKGKLFGPKMSGPKGAMMFYPAPQAPLPMKAPR